MRQHAHTSQYHNIATGMCHSIQLCFIFSIVFAFVILSLGDAVTFSARQPIASIFPSDLRLLIFTTLCSLLVRLDNYIDWHRTKLSRALQVLPSIPPCVHACLPSSAVHMHRSIKVQRECHFHSCTETCIRVADEIGLAARWKEFSRTVKTGRRSINLITQQRQYRPQR